MHRTEVGTCILYLILNCAVMKKLMSSCILKKKIHYLGYLQLEQRPAGEASQQTVSDKPCLPSEQTKVQTVVENFAVWLFKWYRGSNMHRRYTQHPTQNLYHSDLGALQAISWCICSPGLLIRQAKSIVLPAYYGWVFHRPSRSLLAVQSEASELWQSPCPVCTDNTKSLQLIIDMACTQMHDGSCDLHR